MDGSVTDNYTATPNNIHTDDTETFNIDDNDLITECIQVGEAENHETCDLFTVKQNATHNDSHEIKSVINRLQIESNLEDLMIAHEVRLSNRPNRFHCKIPVTSNWKIDVLDALLTDYEDREIIEWLRFGFSISRDVHAPDPVISNINHTGANKFPEVIDKFIENELKLGSLLGPFYECPFNDRIGISPISTRPKKDSPDRRIIVDLSFPPLYSVNDAINKKLYCGEVINLHYPSVDAMAKRIHDLGPGCLLWKIDMSRYFFQLPLCPFDYSLIGIKWKNLIYFFKVIPMGLTSAAYCAQRVSNAISYIHKSHGHWSVNYLDDFGSVELPSNAWRSYYDMRYILENVGAQEAAHKAVPPCTRLEFLGNTLDTITMTIEVSPTRLTEILELLKWWYNAKEIRKKQLQSLIGKLSFITNCVKSGRIFISRLLNWLRTMNNEGPHAMNEDAREDIAWWIRFLPVNKCTSIVWLVNRAVADSVMATDASLVGGGGFCEGQYFHMKFDENILREMLHISQLELYTVCIAIKVWAKRLAGHVIHIGVDNQACMFTINKGRTHDLIMQQLMREIAWSCGKNDILIKAHYIPSRENLIPDLLSRWYIKGEARRSFLRLRKKEWKQICITDKYKSWFSDLHYRH